jgi:hypothetical protein
MKNDAILLADAIKTAKTEKTPVAIIKKSVIEEKPVTISKPSEDKAIVVSNDVQNIEGTYLGNNKVSMTLN